MVISKKKAMSGMFILSFILQFLPYNTGEDLDRVMITLVGAVVINIIFVIFYYRFTKFILKDFSIIMLAFLISNWKGIGVSVLIFGNQFARLMYS